MTRMILLVLPFLLFLSGKPAIAATRCGQNYTAVASHLRLLRASHNSIDHAPDVGTCRAYFKQFVEAVTARQDAAACQDGVERRQALETIDAEIQTFNDRIATHSCEQ